MKKIIFALFVILCFSSNLMAKEPVINVSKKDGLAHYNENNELIKNTYNYVYSYKHSNGSYQVICKDPGYLTCLLVIDGGIRTYNIPRFDNPDITYEFDAALISEITDDMLLEIDNECFGGGELSGNKSRKVGMYDLSGEFHYVTFLAVYQLDKLGNGNILFYIDVIE